MALGAKMLPPILPIIDQIMYASIKLMLVCELYGRQHPIVGVLALRIVEHLDIFEHVRPCVFSRGEVFESDIYFKSFLQDKYKKNS